MREKTKYGSPKLRASARLLARFIACGAMGRRGAVAGEGSKNRAVLSLGARLGRTDDDDDDDNGDDDDDGGDGMARVGKGVHVLVARR